MNKTFGIIGALLFVVAVIIGNIDAIPGNTIIELAISAFGLASLIISTIKNAKEKGNFNWKTIVAIVLSVCAGVLCCIGGLNSNLFIEISAAVLAVMAIILSIINVKK